VSFVSTFGGWKADEIRLAYAGQITGHGVLFHVSCSVDRERVKI